MGIGLLGSGLVTLGSAWAYSTYSDNETPQGTAASALTVAKYALLGLGVYYVYKQVKK